MISYLKTLVVVLSSGYVLFFLSERVFWSFWRSDETIEGVLITWFVYSLITWLMLMVARSFRVASFSPLFLCGALFGWMAEGIVVDTFYGDPSNPMPFSISFTGLAWHALLSVVVGWWFVGRALIEPGPVATCRIATIMGLAWGLWALWWPAELDAATDASVLGFAKHTIAFSLPYLLAWAILAKTEPDWFKVTRGTAWVLSGLVVVIFLGVHVPARPVVSWVLPLLVVPSLLALKRQAARELKPDVLDQLLAGVRLRNVPALLLMPATAILSYALFAPLVTTIPAHIVLYVITMPLGFWFFFRSLWMLLLRPLCAKLP